MMTQTRLNQSYLSPNDLQVKGRQTIVSASKGNPCPHCDKPDWCYSLGNLTVCKRDREPASGWQSTSKTDREGTPYYARITPKKEVRAKGKTEFIYRLRDGQPLVKVTRSDDGDGHKKFYQSSWDGKNWVRGLSDEARQLVPVYRYPEIKAALAAGVKVFWVEGEGVADLLWNIGIPATTTLGGAKGYRKYGDYRADLKGADLVLCPDRDLPGLGYMVEIAQDYPDAKWLYAPPNEFFWPHLGESSGLDIGDWIKDGATKEQIMDSIQDRITEWERLLSENKNSAKDIPNVPDTLNLDVTFLQQAVNFLYGERRWISADGKLYGWNGTYYEYSPDCVERPKIASFCNSFSVVDSEGKVCYPYAKPSRVREVLQWVKDRFEVNPDLLNPPGLNCTNGVLQIIWVLSTPSHRLISHQEDLYYTYEPVVTYDLDANSADCDRLLNVLDKPQQEIFLRTIAASLDLATVRRHKGRLVRGLLLKGDGNNGKDSLREMVAAMYGYQGMTGCTLSDFKAYDDGRKFPLSRLKSSRINWATENANTATLDKLQSIKAFLTGDTLSSEGKGKDEVDYNPAAVGLFNVNDTPNMRGTLEAIASRWGILSFTKTFKIGADPSKGEIEADPRFKYDPEFMRTNVLPAFLNRVLQSLSDLMQQGIDYSCTQKTLENIQRENSHLFQFCQDVGLGYEGSSTVSIGEIWERLRTWYKASGTLTIEANDKGKEKNTWIDQARKGDANVKGANQVLARFLELFPKAKRCHLGDNKMGIQGVAFGISQFEPFISQSLASGLASNPCCARKISQLTQFSDSDEKNKLARLETESTELQNLLGEEKLTNLPNLANPPDAVRVSASPLANPLANPSDELANREPNSNDKTISLLEIEKQGSDPSDFIGCKVEARDLLGKVKFNGQMITYQPDDKTVTITTVSGDRTEYLEAIFVVDRCGD